MYPGEEGKIKHYNGLFTIPEGKIIPLSFETSGRLGDIGLNFLKRFVRVAVAGQDSTVYSATLRRLYEALSVNLQRGNANAIRQHLAYTFLKTKVKSRGNTGQRPGAVVT